MTRAPKAAEEKTLTPDEESTLAEMETAFKRRDVTYFVKLLSSAPSSLLIRVHATCMLESVGNEDSVPMLCRLLRDDPNPLTRHEAAFTLGQLGYASAVPPLVETMLNDPHPIVRHESAVALSSIGDPQAVPPLQKAANDPDDEVRNSAIIAIKYLTYLQRKYQNQPLGRKPKFRL